MRKFLEALLLCLVTFAIGTGAGAIYGHYHHKHRALPPLIPAINAENKAIPLVRLHNVDGDFFCSGVVVAENYIVTAGHCLAGRIGEKVEVRNDVGELVTKAAIIEFSEERSDQGLISGDFFMVNAAPMESRPVQELRLFMDQERTLVACGYPYGGDLFCTTIEQRRMSFFQIAGAGFLYPGMSGGPVFELETQIVVAINTAALDGGILVSPLIEIFKHAEVPMPNQAGK